MTTKTALLGALVGAVALASFVAAFYEMYVPARVDEVMGSVVNREVLANDQTSPRHFTYVRLDSGETVRARTDRFVTPMPGERVVLVKVQTPLLGLHRYRYKRHVDPERKPTAPAERLAPATEPTASECGSGAVARLDGRSYDVILHGGSAEQLYSVKADDGRTIVACSSSQRLREQHADLYRAIGPLLRTLETPDFGYESATPPASLSKHLWDRLRALGYTDAN